VITSSDTNVLSAIGTASKHQRMTHQCAPLKARLKADSWVGAAVWTALSAFASNIGANKKGRSVGALFVHPVIQYRGLFEVPKKLGVLATSDHVIRRINTDPKVTFDLSG
jgi:hypothetical protein